MSPEKEKNAFHKLNQLIDEYSDNKDSYDIDKLQDIRESIALQLFYLSSDYATAISKFDASDWERKRNYAELVEKHKFDSNGVKNTVVTTESLARIENKEYELAVVESLRQKERAKLIVSATTQILNAISSKIIQLKNG